MQKIKIVDKTNKILDRILRRIPDWVSGDTSQLAKKYTIRYGKGDYQRLIIDRKRKTLSLYLMIILLFIFLSVIGFLLQLNNNELLRTIPRPEHGEPQTSLPINVHAKYEDTTIRKNIHLKIRQPQLTESEKIEKIKNLKSQLETIILGNNDDLKHVTEALNLIQRHHGSGATIVWNSHNTKVIKNTGEIDLINAKGEEAIVLEAALTVDGYTEAWRTIVSINSDGNKADYKKTLASRLEESIDLISRSSDSKHLILPVSLGDQIYLEWRRQNSFSFATLIIIFCFGLVFIYLNRFKKIDKEIKERNNSIVNQLPDFVNKLVLLLNAGIVVSTAISKIAEDHGSTYAQNRATNSKKMKGWNLYNELYEIEKRVKQTNVSMINELNEFSKRSGLRELIRVSTIISENINKGSSLSEKLEAEGELLWLSRKKKAEEKGRLAETKLTFPLVILLLVLVMITIAPALMEM